MYITAILPFIHPLSPHMSINAYLSSFFYIYLAINIYYLKHILLPSRCISKLYNSFSLYVWIYVKWYNCFYCLFFFIWNFSNELMKSLIYWFICVCLCGYAIKWYKGEYDVPYLLFCDIFILPAQYSGFPPHCSLCSRRHVLILLHISDILVFPDLLLVSLSLEFVFSVTINFTPYYTTESGYFQCHHFAFWAVHRLW